MTIAIALAPGCHRKLGNEGAREAVAPGGASAVQPQAAPTSTAETPSALAPAAETPAGAGKGSRDAAGQAAGEAIVDQDYRFRLAVPGPGWSLLGERDARQLVPDSLAGAIFDQHLWAVVIVERYPDVALDTVVQLIVSNMALEERTIEQDTTISFQGKEARRIVLSGRVDGLLLRYVTVVLAHEGHIYQLFGWGMPQNLSPGGPELQPFFDAFSLLEGDVTGRDDTLSVADANGPGWRVRDGVFTSATARLRVAPPAGWRVVVGSELLQMDVDAAVGLVSRAPEIYITIIAERAPSLREQAFQRMSRTALGPTQEVSGAAPFTPALAGRKRSFARLRSRALGMEYLVAAFYQAGLGFRITAWYPRSFGDQAPARVAEALASIAFLDARETAAARRALAAEPDRQNDVGQGFALRRGVYRDFAGGWTWRKPPGFWRILVGQSARAIDPDAVLYANEPAKGLHALIVTEPAGDASLASFADAVRLRVGADLGAKPGKARAIALGNGDDDGEIGARAFEIEAEVNGYPLRYRVVALVHQGTGVQIRTWGDAAQMARARREMAAVADGFGIAPGMVAVEQVGRTHRDWRLGFSFDPGAEGWQRQDVTPPAMAEQTAVLTWQKGNRAMVVMALRVFESHHDDVWFFDFLEQRLREQFGSLTRGTPAREDITMAGTPGRHLLWRRLFSRLDAYLVRRDQTLYGIIGVGLSRDDAAALPSRFAFLD